MLVEEFHHGKTVGYSHSFLCHRQGRNLGANVIFLALRHEGRIFVKKVRFTYHFDHLCAQHIIVHPYGTSTPRTLSRSKCSAIFRAAVPPTRTPSSIFSSKADRVRFALVTSASDRSTTNTFS